MENRKWFGLIALLVIIAYITTFNYGGCGGGGKSSSGSSAPAPTAPAVNTGDAINITLNSATLTGTVNPKGLATTAKFQYGITSTPYASNTTAVSVGSGTTAVNMTPADLTSLTPFTTYYYRLTATNNVSTTDGLDKTFNTPISPPATAQLKVDTLSSYSPDIAASGTDGTSVYIVYQSEIGIGYGIAFRKSTDSGLTFPTRVNISPGVNGDSGDKPSIAIDANGNIHVVYQKGDYHIYYARSIDNGVSFSVPIKISDGISIASSITRGPRIATDSTNVYVVWGGDDSRIYIDKSLLTSVSFGTDKMVSANVGFYYNPSIAIDNNVIYVAWHGRPSGLTNDILLSKSSDSAANFSSAVVVDDTTSDVSNPRLAVSGNNVYVAWQDYRDVYTDIRLRASADAGATFPASSIKVNDNTGGSDQDRVDIKIDAKGTIYLLWRDGRNDNAAPDIYYCYASTSNAQLIISANVNVNSALGKATYGYRVPALVIGGGKIYTVWQGQATGDTTWYIYFSGSN